MANAHNDKRVVAIDRVDTIVTRRSMFPTKVTLARYRLGARVIARDDVVEFVSGGLGGSK